MSILINNRMESLHLNLNLKVTWQEHIVCYRATGIHDDICDINTDKMEGWSSSINNSIILMLENTTVILSFYLIACYTLRPLMKGYI